MPMACKQLLLIPLLLLGTQLGVYAGATRDPNADHDLMPGIYYDMVHSSVPSSIALDGVSSNYLWANSNKATAVIRQQSPSCLQVGWAATTNLQS